MHLFSFVFFGQLYLMLACMSARLISKKSFPPTGCAIIIKLERRQTRSNYENSDDHNLMIHSVQSSEIADKDEVLMVNSNPLGPGSVKFPTFPELHDPAKLTHDKNIAHLTRASIALSCISYDHKRPSYSDHDMLILSVPPEIQNSP